MAEFDSILEVRDLVKHFPVTRGVLFKSTIGQVRAVDGVSFDLKRGETLGVVGESGCGKSTLAQVLMRLEPPTSGSALFEGEDIFKMKGGALRRLRRNIQIVLQDPYTSLNPRMTVGDIIGEPFEIHPEVAPKGSRAAKVRELLDVVGLNPEHINRYPHQFSGGQRQRIGIARALALRPKVIVCDEPVSALDVSIQAQVMNLLGDLQTEFGLSYVFIAHDLSVVRHLSDRVAVMYLGKIVEIGTEEQIYEHPTHPYTQALLSAVPVPDPTQRGRRDVIRLTGDVPSPINPPSGCRFRTRCWKAQDICATEVPELVVRAADHPSACHFAEERAVV
ncbi:ABC transporter ATP-binding protein [Lentzea sp. NBRC 105346]|uniref:ABC transporter ATP-binding protein n=1 Tax=Lentzea sp. NBRC 105346 TaxID=3032205 RepID=UPI0024A19018|nr:dipeptide ABC transporter ATP-binding protein [Lentzea sp. NBRC 105346]GLZ34538.1 ABC transporter ATP-binding protein [Lentzea sp. NBRC 105346]